MPYDLCFLKYFQFNFTLFCHNNISSKAMHSLERFMIYVFGNISSLVKQCTMGKLKWEFGNRIFFTSDIICSLLLSNSLSFVQIPL